MRRLVKDFRPDVVNCHRGESFLFWGALKEAGGYALVRTRGDQRLPKGNWPNRMLHTKVADAVIATNSVMARYFAGPMGVPPQRLHTILGGVDARAAAVLIPRAGRRSAPATASRTGIASLACWGVSIS